MWGAAADTHIIAEGRVGCPRRKRDVEVDQCLDCPALVTHDLEGRTPQIRCRPETTRVERLWSGIAF